jgi:hypothetical protein
VCDIDLRPGGAWRFVGRGPQGEYAFHGVYREVHAPERVVFTEIYEPFPDAESVVTSVLTEENGKTRLTAIVLYPSLEVRDIVIGTGMAKGAADAGFHPVVAVIGDSTFLHSGVTPLLDAVASDTPMTLLILDNKTVGMTGGQPTFRRSSELEGIVRGIGINPDHFHVLEAHPRHLAENTEVLRREVNHRGLSVIIAVRECIETAKRSKQDKTAQSA